jgi:hypothetical protein
MAQPYNGSAESARSRHQRLDIELDVNLNVNSTTDFDDRSSYGNPTITDRELSDRTVSDPRTSTTTSLVQVPVDDNVDVNVSYPWS